MTTFYSVLLSLALGALAFLCTGWILRALGLLSRIAEALEVIADTERHR